VTSLDTSSLCGSGVAGTEIGARRGVTEEPCPPSSCHPLFSMGYSATVLGVPPCIDGEGSSCHCRVARVSLDTPINLDSRFVRSMRCEAPVLPALDSHHLEAGRPREQSSSGTVLIAMLGIGESTGLCLAQGPRSRGSPPAELAMLAGDSGSVKGVKLACEPDMGLFNDMYEPMESLRAGRGSEDAEEGSVEAGLGALVGVGCCVRHKFLVRSSTSGASMVENAAAY
jgi:hypothetical protein